jgi:diacylglycerol kinase (ATP)
VNERSGRRCAVVYNPIKVSDDLRDAVARRAGEAGWSDPTWLGTPADNPGQAITADVVSASPDRVIAVGGDGTVRIVADRLAQSGIPMAVVPVGTGNLLARNLEIPLSGFEAHHRPYRRHAMICAIGNVGKLAGNLTLIPGARPDDGRLDVYVASPHRPSHWLRTFLRLITRRPRADDRVDQWRATQVEVHLRHPDPYQLDGDVIGDCRTLRAEVRPGALTVCVPG